MVRLVLIKVGHHDPNKQLETKVHSHKDEHVQVYLEKLQEGEKYQHATSCDLCDLHVTSCDLHTPCDLHVTLCDLSHHVIYM